MDCRIYEEIAEVQKRNAELIRQNEELISEIKEVKEELERIRSMNVQIESFVDIYRNELKDKASILGDLGIACNISFKQYKQDKERKRRYFNERSKPRKK